MPAGSRPPPCKPAYKTRKTARTADRSSARSRLLVRLVILAFSLLIPFLTIRRGIPILSSASRASMSMAWLCSGASNADLVENMWRNKLITDPRVKAAFLKVDRAHYSPYAPYEDSPQPIGHSATISAPHMHASAMEHVLSRLVPSPASPAPRALDIGSGSGYLTHIMAELVGPRGLVVGLEHIRELCDLGESNMRKGPDGRQMLNAGRVRFVVGDGRRGWSEPPREGEEQGGAAWDVIHVGAAAREVHAPLLEQLKAPGCMFIPVDDNAAGHSQSVWRIEKDAEGNVTREKLFGVRYVPLTDAPTRT